VLLVWLAPHVRQSRLEAGPFGLAVVGEALADGGLVRGTDAGQVQPLAVDGAGAFMVE